MSTIHIHFLPTLVPPESLRGSVAVVIDLLRASTTMLRALDAGAARVIPCLEPDEASTLRISLIEQGTDPRRIVLGGERGGVRIPGFDLGNSPAEYTPELVRGRTLIFTTTNGTRALSAARESGASEVLVGCLNNLSAIVDRLAGPGRRGVAARPVHIVCAGTNGDVSQEDVLCAGAIAAGLLERRFVHGNDDQGRIACACWLAAQARAAGAGGDVLQVLRSSRGGRNLLRIGFDADIADCAALDRSSVVPSLTADGSIIAETKG